MTVSTKMVLGVVGMISVIMGVSATLQIRDTRRILNESLEARADLVATTLTPAIKTPLLQSDRAGLIQIVEGVQREQARDILGIRIVDAQGMERGSVGTVSGVEGRRVRRDLLIGGRSYGQIEVLFSLSELREKIRQTIENVLRLTLLFLCVSILLAALLAKRISRPLETLAEASAKISGGDLSTRVPESSSGEVGVLQRSFNVMVDGLAKSRAALEKRLGEMSALYDVAGILHRSSDSGEVLSLALEAAETGFGFTKTAVFLLEGELATRAAVRNIRGIPEQVGADRLTRALGNEPRRLAPGDLPDDWGIGPAIAAPLTAGGKTIGLLVAGGPGIEDETALRLLSVFGSQVAPALHGALLGQKLADRVSDPFTPLAARVGEEMTKAAGFGLGVTVLGFRLEDAPGRLRAEGWEATDARFAALLQIAETSFPDAAFVSRSGADRAIAVLPGVAKSDVQRAILTKDLPLEFLTSLASYPEDGESAMELLLKV